MTYTPDEKIKWRLDKIDEDKRAAAGVVIALQKGGDWKTADRIDMCSGHVVIKINENKVSLDTKGCGKHKLCITCNETRFYHIGKNLNEKILNAGIEGLHSKHLVLTIKNTKQMNKAFQQMAGYTGKDGKKVKGYKSLLVELRRNITSEWYNVVATFGSIECSIDHLDQYHVHLHMITYSYDELDISLLEKEWRKIAGEGSHLNENTIEDNGYHFNNIVSYINKLPSLPDVNDRIKWDKITYRKQMFFTWGEIRKAKVTPKEKYVHGFNSAPNTRYETYKYSRGGFTNHSDDIETNIHHIDDSDLPDFPDFIQWES